MKAVEALNSSLVLVLDADLFTFSSSSLFLLARPGGSRLMLQPFPSRKVKRPELRKKEEEEGDARSEDEHEDEDEAMGLNAPPLPRAYAGGLCFTRRGMLAWGWSSSVRSME